MPGSERIVFGSGLRGGHHLVPEIIECGWGAFREADHGHLKAHKHQDAFELCLIVSGEVEWETADSVDILRAGDLFVTRPNEVHWGRDGAMHPCTLFWLILDHPEAHPQWLGMAPEVRARVLGQLQSLSSRRLRATGGIKAAFADVYREHAQSVEDDPLLRRASVRIAASQLLVEVARMTISAECFGDKREHEAARTEVETLLEALASHATGEEGVREACVDLGIDYERLNARMAELMGVSLSQYWLRERIRRSRSWLEDRQRSITEIAVEFGFSSSQHYATTFRRITGLSPSDYRRSLTSDADLVCAP